MLMVSVRLGNYCNKCVCDECVRLGCGCVKIINCNYGLIHIDGLV